jgi:hypothetical protein
MFLCNVDFSGGLRLIVREGPSYPWQISVIWRVSGRQVASKIGDMLATLPKAECNGLMTVAPRVKIAAYSAVQFNATSRFKQKLY